jgi:hypothetical protein
MKKVKQPFEFKKLINLIENGYTIENACKELKISRNIIYSKSYLNEQEKLILKQTKKQFVGIKQSINYLC